MGHGHPQEALLFDRGFTGTVIEASNATRLGWMLPCRSAPAAAKSVAGAGAGARGKAA